MVYGYGTPGAGGGGGSEYPVGGGGPEYPVLGGGGTEVRLRGGLLYSLTEQHTKQQKTEMMMPKHMNVNPIITPTIAGVAESAVSVCVCVCVCVIE